MNDIRVTLTLEKETIANLLSELIRGENCDGNNQCFNRIAVIVMSRNLKSYSFFCEEHAKQNS